MIPKNFFQNMLSYDSLLLCLKDNSLVIFPLVHEVSKLGSKNHFNIILAGVKSCNLVRGCHFHDIDQVLDFPLECFSFLEIYFRSDCIIFVLDNCQIVDQKSRLENDLNAPSKHPFNLLSDERISSSWNLLRRLLFWPTPPLFCPKLLQYPHLSTFSTKFS